jgi:phospholipid/cholesterol/gamma-HCH transport system permease protein
VQVKGWIAAIEGVGAMSRFAWANVLATRYLWKRRRLFLEQLDHFGFASIPIVAGSGVCLGAALGYQLYFAFSRFGAEGFMGATVGRALFRELAPVMGAIMVTGRGGSAMAAELGSMRVSQQLDALKVMSVDPIELLVMPRVWAGFISMPILAMVFAVMGSFSAAGVSCYVMGIQWPVFWQSYTRLLDAAELIQCGAKAAFFGIILTLTSCFMGVRVQGGSKGVGRATRDSVVYSCLLILFWDFVLTSVLPIGSRALKVTMT